MYADDEYAGYCDDLPLDSCGVARGRAKEQEDRTSGQHDMWPHHEVAPWEQVGAAEQRKT